MEKIIINEKNENRRLDHFLAEILKKISRSQIQKLIKEGVISVDGRPAKVHHFLKAGQIVEFKKTSKEKKIDPRKQEESLPSLIHEFQPEIIFENEDFIVIAKPAGMLVHRTLKVEKDTLADWLKKRYPKIDKIGENRHRAGIIHRLDRDVSGVMVAAKTEAAYNHLKKQFKQRKVLKKYFALVYGRIEEKSGEINLPIGRSKNGLFVAHPKKGGEKLQPEDKIAKTIYNVIEYIKDYSLLEIRILTGRTHQIRVHLTAIGHPILGDRLYRPKKKIFNFLRRRIKVVDPGRIFLHSYKIGFSDLAGQWREYESDMPEVLKKFLNDQKK